MYGNVELLITPEYKPPMGIALSGMHTSLQRLKTAHFLAPGGASVRSQSWILPIKANRYRHNGTCAHLERRSVDINVDYKAKARLLSVMLLCCHRVPGCYRGSIVPQIEEATMFPPYPRRACFNGISQQQTSVIPTMPAIASCG